MFTQAEFNPRQRLVCRALISRYSHLGRGGFYRRPSRLVRFACGDWAWDGGRGRVSWPEQVCIESFFRIPLPPGCDMPSSRLA